MRLAKRLAIVVMAAGLPVVVGSTGALSNESQCRQLEDLARQYAGVKLTSHQQQLKRKMVAWYNGNCKRTRNVHARRTIER
jgi:hypothetical protein